MVVVLLDRSSRIPQRKAQWGFVEEAAPCLDTVAPGHQSLARNAQVAELHPTLLVSLLLADLSALIAAQDHAVDGLVHWNHRGCVIRVAVHGPDDAAGGADHQAGGPVHALYPAGQRFVDGRRHCKGGFEIIKQLTGGHEGSQPLGYVPIEGLVMIMGSLLLYLQIKSSDSALL